MNLYIASPGWPLMRELKERCPNLKHNILLSQARMPKGRKDFFKEFNSIISNVVLDNGAFSVAKSKLDITVSQLLARFVEHCKQNGERYKMVFSPDFNFGPNGFEENYNLLLEMQGHGIEAVPVMHNLRNHELWSYAEEGHEYIAIGQCKGRRKPQALFTVVNRLYREFNIKVHLFGISELKLISGCSAYSCDSKSALDDAVTGIVRFWNPMNVGADKTDVIYFPDDLDKRKDNTIWWYEYAHQDVFGKFLNDKLNLSIDEFTGRKCTLYRQLAATLYYNHLETVATKIQRENMLIPKAW